jgi:predicted DNA-binding mobile mystery protein A
MKHKKLLLSQLSQKMLKFRPANQVVPPKEGWIKTVRTSFGMTLQQLATKLGISSPSIIAMETREKEGTITLKRLREAATALDMDLVYGFIPRDGSIDALVEKKASKLAQAIVHRTAGNMALENQNVSQRQMALAIKARKLELIQNLPKSLWD